MAHPTAVVFALSMAVWVADRGFAPRAQPVEQTPQVSACHSGPSADAPPGVDAEFVVCAAPGK